MPESTTDHRYPLPEMRYDTSHILSPHDPAVDFRAFYPYTPNEVKHRKRTTTAQLKVLETVFRRDTKPNAALRNELAQQLDMTARGVQVWFQNRRAKEKSKSAKVQSHLKAAAAGGAGGAASTAATAAAAAANGGLDSDESLSPLSPSSSALSSGSLKQEDTTLDVEHKLTPPSPPQLHLNTDISHAGWANSPVDPPPDSATFLSHRRSSVFAEAASDLYSLRRGSLPVNAFPQSAGSFQSAPSVEWFDPLSRRRSVDASLQRLAANPYAQIARTKNSALFGPRFGVAPNGRHNHRVPIAPSARPGLHHYPSVPHVNIRRSSMDNRRLGLVLRTSALSPAPTSTPYINSRASLPDGNLYAVSSRIVGSPIPGPLPSPNFSFGAASTPSMTSPSSADSERNSPDSPHSFSFPGADDREDDPGMSPTSYEAYSRFGSIVSIATSESSINSSYFSETAGPRVDHRLTADLHNGGRQDSWYVFRGDEGRSSPLVSIISVLEQHSETDGGSLCSSPGQFLEFPDLDSNAQYGLSDNGSLGMPGYPQEEYGITRPQGIVVPELASNSSYSSNNQSTAASARNTPLDQAATAISLPSTVPISRSSELAFALHSQPGKSSTASQQDPYLAFGTEESTSQASEPETLAPSMYQTSSDSLGSQGSYATFSGGYTPDGGMDSSLFHVYNDSLNVSALSPNDPGAVHNAEPFAAFS
ncbi:hypothetical protein FA15DRAFT_705004 [Coprinopsis marcescibilis]|uniref:Homeobox domain-containing protein n=1 Tax=Coprinopsis marcescibilis TaxID=230819 RepID=A0A5C3KUM6_COPMA|nr:hypothetical protein FA15DRAFT_705004 [Coprinopsis marcescibilis]